MHPIRLQALQAIAAAAGQFQKTNGESKKKSSEIFGNLVLSLKELGNRLSKEHFEAFKKVHTGETKMDPRLASAVADAAKSWALQHGATHFTHWFQPLTGLTAEKHDSFLSYDGEGGVIEKFSGSQLLQSEPDASSFPSGGMRSTFEARGYTAWDPSSPIFIVEHANAKILCVPSVFVSYTGHSLDTKTSMLRSIDALSKAAVEMLHEMGDKNITDVGATIGCEQEYFLIDQNFVKMRPDLLLTGRTLIGGDMPKGQQMEDHYFGAIPARAQAYMVDVETELYKLGIPVKTRHNEVAPAQFETAPIFEDANLASDHNMLTMEVLRRVAERHGLVCLLHEKPFAGINGSGKHNNWSIATNTGENLLEPGKTPHANVRFIAVLATILNAVHKNQVAMRASIATHGNDHRLGANEAPPAIISVFLGSTLTEIVEGISKGEDLSKRSAEKAMIDFGLNRLPSLPKDTTDRNRTSPFAFTGNKFEFRAVGSSQAISFPVSILNAAVSESMREFTRVLREKKAGAVSTESAVLEVAREFIASSKAICFEGNGYSEEWKKEAHQRGLKELLQSPEALMTFAKKEHHDFLVKAGVYKEEELEAFIHVKLEQYAKYLDIEAQTIGTLARQYVIPSAQTYQLELANTIKAVEGAGGSSTSMNEQRESLRGLTELIQSVYHSANRVKHEVRAANEAGDPAKVASAFGEKVTVAMQELRTSCDKIEAILPDALWPLPKYREMLFLR